MPIKDLLPLFRGVMLNERAGLLLPFMLNPQPISHNKNVTWDIEEIPGLPAPIYTFQSGGQRTISFQLFYDGSMAGVSSGHFSFLNPLGLSGIEAIIESFLYPQTLQIGSNGLKSVRKINMPPPVITLVMGLRFWRGFLLSAPIEETKFDKLLNPTQFTAQIEFGVLEDGQINDINVDTRRSLALTQSGINMTENPVIGLLSGRNFSDEIFSFSITL